VIVGRTPIVNRWITERWEPVAIEAGPDDPCVAAPTCIAETDAGSRWRFDGHAITLHRSEAEGYFLNLSSPDPKVFVMCRIVDEPSIPPIRPEVVTVSYNEAARLMDGGERVDAVPMPREILQWLAPFVAEHYKPEPKRKVRRNDPFADRARDGGRRG
jgi:hypothetical protein